MPVSDGTHGGGARVQTRLPIHAPLRHRALSTERAPRSAAFTQSRAPLTGSLKKLAAICIMSTWGWLFCCTRRMPSTDRRIPVLWNLWGGSDNTEGGGQLQTAYVLGQRCCRLLRARTLLPRAHLQGLQPLHPAFRVLVLLLLSVFTAKGVVCQRVH